MCIEIEIQRKRKKNTTIETSRDVILMSSCFFESIDRIRITPIIGRKVISERIGKDIQLLQNYCVFRIL